MKYTLHPMKHEIFYQRNWLLDSRVNVKFSNFCKKVEKDFNDKYKSVFVALGVPAFDTYNMLNISINKTTRGVHHSYEVMFGIRKFAKNIGKVYYSPMHTRIDFDEPLKLPFFIQSGEKFDDFQIDFIKDVNAIEAVKLVYNQLKLSLKDEW